MKTKIWKTTLYLRLSREDMLTDGTADKSESNSITGQRELLRDYLTKHPELQEVAVRVDDGWSGSNFERPAFKEMIEDVKAGRTDCIVVKDLSRFCRNYLDGGEYIERIFPFLGVRFIAVNDGYDSFGNRNSSDDLIIPFKNLINEAYCRDISVKIRSQLDIKRRSGQYIGSFAAYGYLKDERNKNKLVVDPYAADVVRDIFKWKIEGVSPQDIAGRLNRMGVLSPMDYKRSLGMKYSTPFKLSERSVWTAATVLRILKNPLYTGVLTQGKETTPSYNVKKRIARAESEWAVVPDSHEAIVSRMDFDSVQKILRLDTRRSPEGETVPLFSGMLWCGECGASMVRKTIPSGKKKYVYYVCSAHKQNRSCTPHRISDRDLYDIVFESLTHHIEEVVDLQRLLSLADAAPVRTARAEKIQRQIDGRMAEYEKQQKLILSLYENLADGIIDREEYARLKQGFTSRAEETERQMDALREALDEIKEKGEENEWMGEFIRRRGLSSLDREAVCTLIDRIVISGDNTVEIVFRWQDEFSWQTELVKSIHTTQKEAG